jgi:hypothetical protein
MRHFPLRECGYALGVVVLVAAIYVGSYYAMLDHRFVCMAIPGSEAIPIYRFWHESSDRFFGPAHELDRMIRPGYWKAEESTGD